MAYPVTPVSYSASELKRVNNLGNSTLTTDVTSGDTTWTVASTTTVTSWPSEPFDVRCDTEIATCTLRVGSTLTVVRGQQGTTAAAHSTGAEVRVVWAAEPITVMQDELISIEGWSGVCGSLVKASQTGNYTATLSDAVIPVDATGGNITITLFTAVGNKGRALTVLKTDSSNNTVTLDGNGSQTIGSNLTHTLSIQNQSLNIISDGANWLITSFNTTVSSKDITWNTITTSTASAAFNGYVLTTTSSDLTGFAFTPAVGDIIKVHCNFTHSGTFPSFTLSGSHRFLFNRDLGVYSSGNSSSSIVGTIIHFIDCTASLELTCVVAGSSSRWTVNVNSGVCHFQ